MTLTASTREPEPALSVVVLSTTSGEALERCLMALLDQIDPAEMEIAVVTRILDSSARILFESKGVRWIEVAESVTIPEMRVLAVSRSHGETIALVADRYLPSPDWLENLLAARREGWQVVGSSLVDGSSNRAIFYTEYAPFMSPLPAPVAAAIIHCAGYEREVLTRLSADELSGWEPRIAAALRTTAAKMGTLDQPVARYQRHQSIGHGLQQRFHHLRCCTTERLRGSAKIHRVVFSLATPILALRGLIGTFIEVWRRPQERRHLVPALPMLMLLAAAGAVGELTAALTGKGSSAAKVD